MRTLFFRTIDGIPVPALTAAQMREVDRIAVEEYGLGVLQMMENAGRNLALNVIEMLGRADGRVTVLAGSGGNGGGGLCCARHLHNRGFEVRVVLSKAPGELRGAARAQLDVLRAAGVVPVANGQADAAIAEAELTVDALIGYSLRGAPRGRVAALIEAGNRHSRRTLSLDVPSGLDATSGQAPGVVVRPERTLTLALPKTGLRHAPGALYLADIGIPPEVYAPLGISFKPFFGERYWLRLIPNFPISNPKYPKGDHDDGSDH
jgi:NAD(P)H-hydrate epimerase